MIVGVKKMEIDRLVLWNALELLWKMHIILFASDEFKTIQVHG